MLIYIVLDKFVNYRNVKVEKFKYAASKPAKIIPNSKGNNIVRTKVFNFLNI